MANSIIFDEGVAYLGASGLPATCYFGLSTKSVAEMTVALTLAGAAWGEITGTGYGRKSQARPAASGNQYAFTEMTWETATNSDWPANVKSVAMMTTSNDTGKLLAAANLVAGGLSRDMAHAGTTEAVSLILPFTAA